MSAIRAAKV